MSLNSGPGWPKINGLRNLLLLPLTSPGSVWGPGHMRDGSRWLKAPFWTIKSAGPGLQSNYHKLRLVKFSILCNNNYTNTYKKIFKYIRDSKRCLRLLFGEEIMQKTRFIYGIEDIRDSMSNLRLLFLEKNPKRWKRVSILRRNFM